MTIPGVDGRGSLSPTARGRRQPSLGAEGMERSSQGANGDKISYPSRTTGWSRHLLELRGRGGRLKRRRVGRGPIFSEVTEQPSPEPDGKEKDAPQLRGRSGPKAELLPIACRPYDLPDGLFPPGRRDPASSLIAPPHSPGPRGRGLSRARPEGGLLSPPGAATPP